MNIEPRVVSKNERVFLTAALSKGLRLDGRRDVDCRPLSVAFIDNGNCEVQLGKTRVVCSISAEGEPRQRAPAFCRLFFLLFLFSLLTREAAVVEPFPDRGNDGMYSFDVVLSPMGSSAFAKEAWTDESVELCRIVERTLRDSNAIDTESLCILAGSKVWSIAVTLIVLDAAGNLVDACSAAALASLMHFRRPAVTVDASGKITKHSFEEQDPAPLAIHHTPVT